ncbi:MAG TPA: DUF1572 family protein [Chitinophagaceae bacterium]|nr:DUF1572 family protein [Chitinophagaceae bacterium]
MIEQDFLASAIKRLRYYKDLADKTFEQLDDAGLHYQLNEASNSIAVIIQHMSGNMLSRWTNFLTEDGEKSWRHRDDEFEVHGQSRQELIDIWEKGWKCFFDALQALQPADLEKTIHIRTEALTVIDAINRQLMHYPYHIGQIVYIGRMLRNNDWKSLSIPKGQSETYNAQMKK